MAYQQPQRKLTTTEAEKIARVLDPEAWDKMTPAERRDLVAQVKAHDANAFEAKAFIRRSPARPSRGKADNI